MGGFAKCPGPIWRIDDFTNCFISDYLKTIFPLTVVLLSILRLTWFTVGRAIRERKSAGYDPVSSEAEPTARDQTDIPPSPVDSEFAESEDLEINSNGRLILARTTSRGSVVQADKPPAQLLVEVIEELAIVGLVVTNAVALVTDTYGTSGRPAAIAGLLVWIYTLVLTSLRLFLGQSQWRVPRLWNHTASIYTLNWLFIVPIVRSAIIHPSSGLTETLTVLEFVLTSVLFGMAITTRKGNKTVMMEWENGIQPSREPLASIFSILTYSWVDDIIRQGWKQSVTLGDVWNLLPKDKAATLLSNYRKKKQTRSLAVHLLGHFWKDLAFMVALAVFFGVATFAPTMLVKAILEYVESPNEAPRNVIWLLVILLPIIDMTRSVAENMALWTGRKVCIRIRAITIGEIYAKALRRKAAAGVPKSSSGSDAGEAKNGKGGLVAWFKSVLGIKSAPAGAADDNNSEESDEDQANLGTIINLMSVDTFKIAELTAYFHSFIGAAPVQLFMSVFLLWRVMGLSAIPGIVIMVLLLPINYFVGLGFQHTFNKMMIATDKRIHITNEVLQNIRIIKYFAWERRFGGMINEARETEISAIRSRYIVWAMSIGIYNSVPILITFCSFFVYTFVEGKQLVPSVAFTAISLFMLLRMPLDLIGEMFAHVQESMVSFNRVDEFLSEDETEKYEQLGFDNCDEDGLKRIGFKDTTLIWGGKDDVAADGSQAFRLLDLNLYFQIGKINVIAGPTGSGKTSILMGLLGEMTRVKGTVYCPGGRSREEVLADPETGLADTIAYVAQSAWLVNASIRENITFAAPFDEKRYVDVVRVCALERDLDILDHGDRTLVGEKGITLSGGQKQRISLARAIYSNSAHILMDDCLSAVDSHTAHWIYNQCIRGPLMNGRTCILVTHNTQLCAPSADYVVLMDNGRIAAQGSAKDLILSGKLGDELKQQFENQAVSREPSRLPSRVPSSVGEGDAELEEANNILNKTTSKIQINPMDEGISTGAVKWSVIKLYLFSMGSHWYWVIALFIFLMQQLAPMATNFWVREWANQYVTREIKAQVSFSSLSQTWGTTLHPKAVWATVANLANIGSSPSRGMTVQSASGIAQVEEPAGVNDLYYISGLAIIGSLGAISALMRDVWIFYGSLTASRSLHKRLINAVLRAKFKFFDVTPLGQLMNRFSKDLEAIDQEIAPTAIGFISCAMAVVVTVILIASIIPGFLIAAFFISIGFYFVSVLYLGASRDLKRLESVQRTPIYQQFGETLTGITTIRAYGDQRRFIRDNLNNVNGHNRPFIYMWACNRWLAFRADFLGQAVTFSTGVFIIFSIGKIDSGAAGIVLSYAMTFTENVLWFIRQYGENQQNMNAMERVKEYLDIEQEAPAVVKGRRPPESWPEYGCVEFFNYSTRYREDLEPVLRNISVKINPKEKVGIVGRTGAGKSSLTLALFRALEADSGRIVVDDMDISTIGLQDLREKITIVPQDPTLFTGTLRSNLDPFDQFSDGQIFEALRRVHLITAEELSPASSPVDRAASLELASNKNIFLDLSSTVAESGSNLSQGQRQLLCLARAMLKLPKVLVMDEATASIDYNTDAKIQETIREMQGTVITIAHRLQTIVDYDKVLVLDKGVLVEYAHPWELISDKKTQFFSMCESSGDLEILKKAAKKKWEQSN